MTIDHRKEDQIGEVAAFLKAVGNRNRLMILCRLVQGECAVSVLEAELEIWQPILSQQLAGLRDAGLIEPRREAKAVFYRLVDDRIQRFVAALHALFSITGAHPEFAPIAQFSVGRQAGRAEAAVFALVLSAKRGRP